MCGGPQGRAGTSEAERTLQTVSVTSCASQHCCVMRFRCGEKKKESVFNLDLAQVLQIGQRLRTDRFAGFQKLCAGDV